MLVECRAHRAEKAPSLSLQRAACGQACYCPYHLCTLCHVYPALWDWYFLPSHCCSKPAGTQKSVQGKICHHTLGPKNQQAHHNSSSLFYCYNWKSFELWEAPRKRRMTVNYTELLGTHFPIKICNSRSPWVEQLPFIVGQAWFICPVRYCKGPVSIYIWP